jgi:DNA polymerase-3 subunit beta
MPALANALLSAADGMLTVSATDLYLAAVVTAEAEIETPGTIALPAKDLLDRLKNMPEGPVCITVKDGHTAVIASGVKRSLKYTLQGIDAKDYPELPKPPEDAAWLKFGAATLRRMLDQTHKAISTDETRPHVNSLCFDFDGRLLRCVATDGNRLHLVHTTCDSPRMVALLPLKAVLEVRRILDKQDGDVEIAFAGPCFYLRSGSLVWSAKTIDHQFPPFAQVIPAYNGKAVKVNRKAFLELCKAVKVAATEKQGWGVVMTFAPGTVHMAANSPDTGSAEDEIAADGDCGATKIGANATFLEAALADIPDDEIRLCVTGELDPIAIRTDDDVDVWVVMPVRV